MLWDSNLEQRSVWSRMDLKNKLLECNLLMFTQKRKIRRVSQEGEKKSELGHFQLQWEQSLDVTGTVGVQQDSFYCPLHSHLL